MDKNRDKDLYPYTRSLFVWFPYWFHVADDKHAGSEGYCLAWRKSW
jgi:hypothetical protein